MTHEKFNKFLRCFEAQKRDPELLRIDGPYCFRKFKEHLSEVKDLIKIFSEEYIDIPELIVLRKKEATILEVLNFYQLHLENISTK